MITIGRKRARSVKPSGFLSADGFPGVSVEVARVPSGCLASGMLEDCRRAGAPYNIPGVNKERCTETWTCVDMHCFDPWTGVHIL